MNQTYTPSNASLDLEPGSTWFYSWCHYFVLLFCLVTMTTGQDCDVPGWPQLLEKEKQRREGAKGWRRGWNNLGRWREQVCATKGATFYHEILYFDSMGQGNACLVAFGGCSTRTWFSPSLIECERHIRNPTRYQAWWKWSHLIVDASRKQGTSLTPGLVLWALYTQTDGQQSLKQL